MNTRITLFSIILSICMSINAQDISLPKSKNDFKTLQHRATELEDDRALYELAYCYLKGIPGICKTDYGKSLKLMKKSADAGNAEACVLLFKQDKVKYYPYKKQAEEYYLTQRTGFACYQLAVLNSSDLKTMKSWLKTSKEAGYSFATNDLQKLYNNEHSSSSYQTWYNGIPMMDIRLKHEKDEKIARLTLESPTLVNSSSYNFSVGINTRGRIIDYGILVNGIEHRGAKPVPSKGTKGYDMEINRELPLREGKNEIEVTITNNYGSTTQIFPVIYNTKKANLNMSERRVALVIGNSAYRNMDVLNTTLMDAAAVGQRLSELGFETTLETEIYNKQDFEERIKKFERLANNTAVAVVYYAGHGVEFDGKNYLLPLNVKATRRSDLPQEAVTATYIVDRLEQLDCKMKVMILDACRNDPFKELEASTARGGGKERGGLAEMNAEGTMVVFSTAPKEVAQDALSKDDKNSPFATAFLEELNKGNRDVRRVFENVTEAVYERTKRQQRPWVNSTMIGTFTF